MAFGHALAAARRSRQSVDRWLTVGAWAIPLLSVALATTQSVDPIGLLFRDVDAQATQILTIALPAFFAVLLSRVLLTGLATPRRWVGLTALAAGICTWAAGAATLNAAGVPTTISFPAPGEWLFVACSLRLAAYLLLDRPSRAPASLSSWLDAAIVCGGAACVAGALLMTPVAAGFSRQGVPLLIALLYPILDVSLLVLVLGQVILGVRSRGRGTVLTVLGLAALITADTSIVVNLSLGTYRYGALLDLTWTVGFLLLVQALNHPQTPPDSRRTPSTATGRLTVAAAAVAIVVLAAEPPGEARLLLTVPAVLTLGASAARLLQAVRQARGAAEAYRLSLTDDLTALPNRRALNTHLTEALSRDQPVGLLLLDLDGFKEINDTLGHSAGDTLLQIVATRMDTGVPEAVLVARLGGDEFALVFHHVDVIGLLEAAHTARAIIRKPALVDGMELTLDSSIGVAVTAPGIAKPGDLLRRADVAMYQAKSTRAGSLVYDVSRDEFSRQRLALGEDLRRGIARGELELWYQPQLDVGHDEVVSVEALVRWRHPTHGVLAPGAFLATARRAGLMPALTEATIRAAVGDASRWHGHGRALRVALNIAPAELLAEDVMTALTDCVRSAGLPAERIVIEVTEDSFLAEPERARLVLADLRSGGFEVSIDDYGTGFSSLSYLRDLPLHELKIDRSFVSQIEHDRRSLMIVSTTTDLAHGLGLRVVAEGVETAGVADRLRGLGVDILQGYHIARPMPAAELVTWLAQRRREGLGVPRPSSVRQPRP